VLVAVRLQLATDQKVKLEDVRLYVEASEAAKDFVGRYFDKQLYFDYTHLVCRTALDGLYSQTAALLCAIVCACVLNSTSKLFVVLLPRNEKFQLLA